MRKYGRGIPLGYGKVAVIDLARGITHWAFSICFRDSLHFWWRVLLQEGQIGFSNGYNIHFCELLLSMYPFAVY